MTDFDPRITPARPDLAAAHLRDEISADKYVEADAYQVSAGVAAVRSSPADDAIMVSQALLGERVDLYEIREGWGWGQLVRDGYVGWLDMATLSAPAIEPTHRVSALRTYVFSEPDLKSPPRFLASLTSEIAATDRDGNWVKADRGGWLFVDHLAPLSVFADDFVAVAEQFVGAPYLWGGKESLGLDCSGLVQTALAAAGVAAPRDSDMQEAAIGAPISHAADLSNLQRGDLVFWRGHVGVMIDEKHLLHANAHHMATAIEPLVQTVERLTPAVGPIRSVRRL